MITAIGKLIDACAHHRGLVIMAYVVLGWLALRALERVPLDAVPDLSDPQVIVFTEWRGRSPTLVEDQVTYPLTASLLAAPGVEAVRGYSMFGMSFVHVLFAEDVDVYWARSRVQEYLAGIGPRLPEGAAVTLGPDATGIGWVFEYALVDRTGQHDLAELRALQDFELRYALESVQGVAQVASVGGYERQFQAQLDLERLRAHGLTVADVADAVRKTSGESSGRILELGGREAFVRGRGYLKDLAGLEQAVLKASPELGAPLRLGDVAQVRFGPDIRRGLAELDGQGEVVGAIVVARYGTNARDVIERVKARLDEVAAGLPPGVEVVTTYDRSDLIDRAIATLKAALVEEGVVVALVILIFLLHVRSALLPIVGLPLAVLLAFLPMAWLGIPATIMSLGGIAIAIGATVDAEIVMVEACHKRLEHAPKDMSEEQRRNLLAEAAREVTPAIFFSLLIIAVAFIPVFGLEGQAGRLFKPLAYTKTFVMLAAALLSVTLAPALRDLLVRGKIYSEERHPISRAIRAVYEPFVYVALRKPRTTLAIGLFAVLSAIPVFMRLGSEFMPALNEGDILYMPTTFPGLSIEEAKRQLARQDALLAEHPEVERVFGKVGRAETATDPAPLSMVETVVMLRPPEEWPTVTRERWWSGWTPEFMRGPLTRIWPEETPETWDELVAKLSASVQMPGWTQAFTMPIRARVDMLTTGVRTPVGVKVFGRDLTAIEAAGARVEAVLRDVPGTRSILYERSLGGVYVDIVPRRDDLARHGLQVADLGEFVDLAIGGEPIAATIDGRRRYTVQLRVAGDLRDDLERLRELPVAVPGPASAVTRTVPLSEVADVALADGPPMLRSEAGLLVGYVYVDIEPWRDLGGYVTDARARVDAALEAGELVLGPGMYLKWTGQYEQMQAMEARMRVLIPLALALVALLLWLQFRDLTEVLIVLLSIPFALVGSAWLLYLLDYRLSTAVWVGIIALVGLAAQTGVVMIVYIDQAFFRRLRAGKIRDLDDIIWAHMEGTVLRVRPKLMTVASMMLGLVPLLWATGSGADVMKRIAAPMVGGLVSSAFLTLELIPVVYTYWRYAQLRRSQRTGRPLAEICGLDR
ncbi:efflux RND transporter permease subunit [Nannocystis radixulma]|uniref:Efflux RND transporter permease subunit n=1 Tax=Nannocystis radixulma TaxID=2995305 RepID=A0ABT5B972_9BACT|nr:efflux RND transporter permease subunit [Nannocystis radixulma]MDC0670680.1 efflux RND transporter permease subunit [Nannocystis radixulma]